MNIIFNCFFIYILNNFYIETYWKLYYGKNKINRHDFFLLQKYISNYFTTEIYWKLFMERTG